MEYRRKHLALVCGAKLILECLDRNLYPSWDAQNKGSVALSEMLGFHKKEKVILGSTALGAYIVYRNAREN